MIGWIRGGMVGLAWPIGPAFWLGALGALVRAGWKLPGKEFGVYCTVWLTDGL